MHGQTVFKNKNEKQQDAHDYIEDAAKTAIKVSQPEYDLALLSVAEKLVKEREEKPQERKEGEKLAGIYDVSETKKGEKKLNDLIGKSQTTLLKISNIFPFDFFPDDVVIDVNKVSVINRPFFFSSYVHSVSIKDVFDVLVETNVLFATLRIVDRNFMENVLSVNYLWKSDAFKARRIIQGLLVAAREGIDLSKADEKNLRTKLEELGAVHTSH